MTHPHPHTCAAPPRRVFSRGFLLSVFGANGPEATGSCVSEKAVLGPCGEAAQQPLDTPLRWDGEAQEPGAQSL